MAFLTAVVVALQLVAATPPEVAPVASVPIGHAFVLRDGARTLSVERTPSDPRRVVLTYADGRRAHATVGPDAIMQVPRSALAATLADHDLTLVTTLFARAELYRVRSKRPGEDGLALAARLAWTLDVFPDFAFARRLDAIHIPPDDPKRGGQWYLDTIDITDAWRIESGDESTVIAVVDDGCDMTHPDLAAHVEPGRDLVDDDDDPSYLPNAPNNEHGTACSGLVAAVGDNGVGIAGTCPECHFRMVRLLPGDGIDVPIGSDVAAYAQQLDWGIAVSSNSWGFEDHFPVPNLLKSAIETLVREGRDGLGAIVVFAVGNDAREVKADELYGIDGVLTIGAINAFDELASFSNTGDPLDLVAPAGTLTTDIAGRDGADPGDYDTLFGGTSSACPVAAGVAALLVAAYPDKTGAELTAALIASARPAPFAVPDAAGHDASYGYGIVDPTAALKLLAPPDTAEEAGPEATPEPTPEASPEDVAEPEPQPEASEPRPEATEPQPADNGGCEGAGPIGAAVPLLLGLFATRPRRRV